MEPTSVSTLEKICRKLVCNGGTISFPEGLSNFWMGKRFRKPSKLILRSCPQLPWMDLPRFGCSNCWLEKIS